MQFVFGDCELRLVTGHVLNAGTDVIVSPAKTDLAQTDGLAAEIAHQAGDELLRDSQQLLREYGDLESGMALYTRAGQLPCRSVIHAVVPEMGDAETQRKLELAISRSLQLCEMNEWVSIAFPTFSESGTDLTVSVCAQALFRAITRFWDARHETVLRQVMICLEAGNYHEFCAAFRAAGSDPAEAPGHARTETMDSVGYLDLSSEDAPVSDDEIDSWFR